VAVYVFIIGLCMGPRGMALLKATPQTVEAVKSQSVTIAYGPAIFIGVCIGAWVGERMEAMSQTNKNQHRRGAAMVEMAIVLVLLLMLTLG